jgi:dephospho-CoA kinase
MLKRMSKGKIIDADSIAKKYLHKYRARILAEFPGANDNGSINKKKLAEIVFNDTKSLMKLEKIIHPPVIREIREHVKTGRTVIIDAPLLIETGLHREMDCVILVKASRKEQIKRLRRKFSEREIEKRLRYQMPLTRKEKYADYVIDNDNSLKNTRTQVEKIWKKIK